MTVSYTAAIYARKSTTQAGDDEAKSVTRQIENAKAFAVAKGWTVDDAHVYSDDAVGGAETTKLINRQRLLGAIRSGRAPFQVLVIRDASRFSRRDGDEAFAELKAIVRAGVAVHFYADGTQFEYGTLATNVVGFIRSEMAADYRRQIASWTSEALVRKWLAGHVAGGRVFGYDNVRVNGHTERRVNETEAAIVRQIFDLCAAGTGYTRIAKMLNAEHTVAPHPQLNRPSGWSPSSVREALHRTLYRGEDVYCRTKKRDAAGQRVVTTRPVTAWMRADRPEQRIVSDDQWNAAHARLRSIKSRLGTRQVTQRDIESKWLLSGFSKCATCGGALAMVSRSHGASRAYFYGCLVFSKRGPSVCTNSLVLPVGVVNDAVLKAIVGVLSPAMVMSIIDTVFEAMTPAATTANVDGLRKDLQALDKKIANLTAAIEAGAGGRAVATKLAEREVERDALLAAIGAASAVQQMQVDRATVEQRVLEQVARWRTLLTTGVANVADGRQLLREVLDGPLKFTAEGKQYVFEGDVQTGPLVAGLVGLTRMASPTGFEPVFWP